MTSTSPHVPPPRSNRLIIGVLLVAAVAPFARSLAFGYVMDDTTVIRSNADLDGWASLWRVWTHPYGGESSPYFGLYRPLTMALFAFVWNAGGHWALWFHVLAIALHAGATLLAWRVLELAVARAPALFAALLFAVHPLHVEAVANVANSSEVLVAIWTCLLTLHLARVDAGNDGRQRGAPVSWPQAAVAGLLYLAAFLTKESGAVAPVLSALCIWGWRRAGNPHESIREHAARWRRVAVTCALAAAVVVIARALVLGGPVTGEPIAAAGLDDRSAASRVGAMLALGPRIVRLLVWPAQLNPHYGPTTFPATAGAWLAVGTLALLALGVWAGVRLGRRGDRRMLVAIGWSVVAFLPASNILVPTGQILAERTLYVPSIGVAMLAALALDAIRTRSHANGRARHAWNAAVVFVGVALAASVIRTSRWTEFWRGHASLFGQMIAADSAGYRGYWLSGLEARRVGRSDAALALLARAYALYPRDRGLMTDYAETLLRNGHPARAASVAAGLVSPPRRAQAREAELYLQAVGAAFGAESLRVTRQRLLTDRPPARVP